MPRGLGVELGALLQRLLELLNLREELLDQGILVLAAQAIVFNSQWRVIALHHWGGPWIEQTDDAGRPLDIKVNEGIRIGSIVSVLRNRQDDMDPQTRRSVMAALDSGGSRALTAGTRPPLRPLVLHRRSTRTDE